MSRIQPLLLELFPIPAGFYRIFKKLGHGGAVFVIPAFDTPAIYEHFINVVLLKDFSFESGAGAQVDRHYLGSLVGIEQSSVIFDAIGALCPLLITQQKQFVHSRGMP